MNNKLVSGFLLIIVIVGIVLTNSMYRILEIQKAVKLRFGEIVVSDLKPGLHFKIPVIENVKKFDARKIILDSEPKSYFTLEKKALIVDSYVVWRVGDPEVFYKSTSGNLNTASSLLSTRIDTNLRNEFSKRNVTDVIFSDRETLMEDIKKNTYDIVLKDLGVEIIDIRVSRIDLPDAVSQSVYARMSSERERQARELRAQGREEAEVIKARADKQSLIILSKAEQEAQEIRGSADYLSTKIYNEAYGQDIEFFKFYRSLDAYSNSFLNNNTSTFVFDSSSDFFKNWNKIQQNKD